MQSQFVFFYYVAGLNVVYSFDHTFVLRLQSLISFFNSSWAKSGGGGLFSFVLSLKKYIAMNICLCMVLLSYVAVIS